METETRKWILPYKFHNIRRRIVFYITQKNWDKILGYAEEAYDTEKSEIGGMSVMVEDKDGDWTLQDPVILKQEITASNTVLEKEALSRYYSKVGKKMGNKNFRFCWWHSHHTMSAFWSGTDITAIDEYSDGDFSFALVVNLKGEYKFRVSVWQPVEAHQDVELEIINAKHRCTKKMKEEVKTLCSKPSYSYSWKRNGTYGYKSADQLLKDAAEDPRQERLPFRSTAGQTTSSGKKIPHINDFGTPRLFTEIVTEVDALNSALIDGTLKYKDYEEAIEELNDELIVEDSMYKVNLIREEQVNDLLHILPAQLVVYDTSDDLDLYNASYGGYYK